MGMLRSAMKAGIAKKAWDQARKPENQAKAKELFNKVTGKGGDETKSTKKTRSSRRR